MRKLAAALRTELIPPRYKWIAEGVGAAVAASIACACLFWSFAELWLWGLIWAGIALDLAVRAAGAVAEKVIRRRALRRARDGGCVRCVTAWGTCNRGSAPNAAPHSSPAE